MLPEIIVMVTAFAVLLLDVVMSERQRWILGPLSLAGLGLALVAMLATPQHGQLLGGRFEMDVVTWWFQLMFLLAGAITVLISLDLLDGRARVRARGIGFRGEYYTVLLFSLTGMMYLIAARDLITLYVSLELSTMPLFLLAAWQRDHLKSAEAGIKYVIYGALASAFLLYGLSFVYGVTRSMNLDALAQQLLSTPSPILWLAMAFIVAGVGFKMTIVPFHMWAADVYEGAPVPVTAYLSVASKGAGLALLFQIFIRMCGPWLADWSDLIAFFAFITMTLGNVVAIVQQNIKRFMGFSAISQAGYILLGFLGPLQDGIPAMLFYMLVYIVTNMAVFAGIVWFSNETGRENIKDYRGLSQTNPLMALAMTLGLFSLAGIPPLSGFVGKFFLFSVCSQAGYHWLVAAAALNSTVSLYYYLRVVRQMYIEPPVEGQAPLRLSVSLSCAAAVLSAGVVLLGIFPGIYETMNTQVLAWLDAGMHIAAR